MLRISALIQLATLLLATLSAAPATQAALAEMHGDGLLQVPPFIASGATVTGELSAEAQAAATRDVGATAGGGSVSRKLLHGPHLNIFKFPKCPRCKFLSCTGKRKNCIGHCRRGRKLFNCKSPVTRPGKPFGRERSSRSTSRPQ